MLVLERLSGARRRGARVHAEILGASSVGDGWRQPKTSVDGQVRAMREAFEDARLGPEEVGYINAHATSTPVGDALEVAAIKAIFGARAARIPINATKSMI